MLKKSIKYEDFDGNEVTEDFYFHLSKADLVELEVSHKGGLSKWIENVQKSEDGHAILTEFKKLLRLAIGKRSDDGRRFIKTEEIRQDFESSPAYDALFMELVTSAEKAAEFINGVIPKGLEQQVAAAAATSTPASEVKAPSGVTGETGEKNVFEEHAVRTLTPTEVREMDAQDLKYGLAEGRYKL